MKRNIMLVALMITLATAAKAQKGTIQIGIAGEMGLPVGHFDNDFNTGFGGSAKLLYGVTRTGKLCFTTGYSYFKAKGQLSDYHASAGIIPFLAGYRLSSGGFYVEPQVGYGLYRLDIKNYYGQKNSETDGAFTYGAGIGFAKNKIDAGVRYQGSKKGSDDISLISIHIGYTFSLNR